MNLTLAEIAALFVRCHACGEPIEGFAGTCPSCGADLTEAQA
jgi:rRNA maturation endonuclease Nob1